MNTYKTILGSFGRRVSTYLAATATVAVIAVASSAVVSLAHADPGRDCNHHDMDDRTKALLYDLDQLEVQFHEAGSYGGDIDAMMALWADDCTLTGGGVVLKGKDAVRASFAAGGPFTHYWVGLTAAFKIAAEPHGDTADIYFECHYADPSVTPYVLRADRSLYGTVKKVHGKWLFWHMFGDAAPL
jgi:ketosteroid isomerase-like protein